MKLYLSFISFSCIWTLMLTAWLRYNLNTTWFFYLEHKLMFFSIFTKLYNHHHDLILEHFCYPPKIPNNQEQSHFPQPFSHRPPAVYFLVSMDLPIVYISYKWNHISHLLCLVTFLQQTIFIHIGACVTFFSLLNKYFIVRIQHISFIHSLVDNNLFFHFFR